MLLFQKFQLKFQISLDMCKLFVQQTLTFTKKSSSTSALVNLSSVSMASQMSVSTTNKALKQINMTLQGFSAHFNKIDANISKLDKKINSKEKSLDFKNMVDKSMTDLKISEQKVEANVAIMVTKLKEFESRMNIAEFKLEEMETQTT